MHWKWHQPISPGTTFSGPKLGICVLITMGAHVRAARYSFWNWDHTIKLRSHSLFGVNRISNAQPRVLKANSPHRLTCCPFTCWTSISSRYCPSSGSYHKNECARSTTPIHCTYYLGKKEPCGFLIDSLAYLGIEHHHERYSECLWSTEIIDIGGEQRRWGIQKQKTRLN